MLRFYYCIVYILIIYIICIFHVFLNTVNVDIFACIHFRGFFKMGNITWINGHTLRINGSLGYHKSYFHGVHIFVDI